MEFKSLTDQWLAMTGPQLELEDMLQRVYVSEVALTDFMNKHKENALLHDTIAKAGLAKGVLPGDLGSGLYGKDEIAAFEQIRDSLSKGKFMCASTKTKISDPDNMEEIEKGNAGEAKVSGLAAKHAYTVLDYKPKHSEYEYKSGEAIQVQLRNPWGHYGRKYEQNEGKLRGVADRDGDGSFWIDLADLVAYFDHLSMLK